jgi:hypothetical protein
VSSIAGADEASVINPGGMVMTEPHFDPAWRERLAGPPEPLGDGTFRVRLKDGHEVVVNADGVPVSATVDTRGLASIGASPGDFRRALNTTGSQQRNVGLSGSSGTGPIGLRKSGHPGENTQWDLESMQDTITWLDAHAQYLSRLYHGMAELPELIDGPSRGGRSALGGFGNATQLHARHAGAYEAVRAGLRQRIDALYDDRDALAEVVRRCRSTEERNRLELARWQSIAAEAARTQHQF